MGDAIQLTERGRRLSRREVLQWGAAVGVVTAGVPLLKGGGALSVLARDGRRSSEDARAHASSSLVTLAGAFDEGPGGEPQSFNPLINTAGMTWIQMYYSPLVLWNSAFTTLQGELAESWQVSPDGREYTFNLRKVTWHDGKPFTAQDVKFTLELATNPDSASYIGGLLPAIASISTPDPSTAVVKLRQPAANFLSSLAWLVMLPRHALAKYSAKELLESSWWHTNPIGTGPFKWEKWVPDQYNELSAFDNYWRGRPKIDRAINIYYTDPSASIVAMEKGTILFNLYITLEDVHALTEGGKIRILAGPSQVFNYLAWNLRDSRFTDLRVRQAFMYAIDRKAIVKDILEGGAVIAPGPWIEKAYVPSKVNAYDYNPGLAQKLLAEANWGSIKGAPIQLITYYTDSTTLSVLDTMQSMLNEVGISVEPSQVETATYTDDVEQHNFDMVYAGIADGPDPSAPGAIFTKTSSAESNYMDITNGTLASLFAKGEIEVDLAKRTTIYRQLNELFDEQLPVGPMWVATRYGALSKSVKNFVFTPAPGGGQYYANWQDWEIS